MYNLASFLGRGRPFARLLKVSVLVGMRIDQILCILIARIVSHSSLIIFIFIFVFVSHFDPPSPLFSRKLNGAVNSSAPFFFWSIFPFSMKIRQILYFKLLQKSRYELHIWSSKKLSVQKFIDEVIGFGLGRWR